MRSSVTRKTILAGELTEPWFLRTAALVALGAALVGCGRSGDDGAGVGAMPPPAVEGRPIRALAGATNLASVGPTIASTNSLEAQLVATSVTASGHLALSFELLAGFPYRVYEYYAEGVSGRPLLKSDDVIPEVIRRLDGRKVIVRGFVLPLRTRQGRVTEFLLLKDQGTCCFGAQAQINHFVRVNFRAGRTFESGQPYAVTGRLGVGETYVQGYLTGIYQLEAESVDGP